MMDSEFDLILDRQERVWKYVARKNAKGVDPEIRQIAKALGLRQSVVLQTCEDLDLCVNVGFATGFGYAELDSIGDYTVECLD